jgi:hypothetical protein
MMNRKDDVSQSLCQLAEQLEGTYENRSQAIESPIWYVHLKAWWRSVPLFTDDSITFFAEQANILKCDQPYRQRLMRLYAPEGRPIAQFYQFKNPNAVLGAGANPSLISKITELEIKLLPGCILDIEQQGDGFSGRAREGDRCCFSYPDGRGGEKVGQVALGFEVGPGWFKSYDKGVNAETGAGIWGALMGPYCYTKCVD